jgi:hypothetical protein
LNLNAPLLDSTKETSLILFLDFRAVYFGLVEFMYLEFVGVDELYYSVYLNWLAVIYTD